MLHLLSRKGGVASRQAKAHVPGTVNRVHPGLLALCVFGAIIGLALGGMSGGGWWVLVAFWSAVSPLLALSDMRALAWVVPVVAFVFVLLAIVVGDFALLFTPAILVFAFSVLAVASSYVVDLVRDRRNT